VIKLFFILKTQDIVSSCWISRYLVCFNNRSFKKRIIMYTNSFCWRRYNL